MEDTSELSKWVEMLSDEDRHQRRVVDNFDRRVEEFLPATITTNKWSLLYAREGAPVELYDLESDPEQEKNVAADNSDVVKNLHGNYVNLLEELGTEERLLSHRRKL